MKGLVIILGLLVTTALGVKAQTCTIVVPTGTCAASTCSGDCMADDACGWNWVTGSVPTCQEGGVTTSTASILIIPAGLAIRMADGTDGWTGTTLQVYGSLRFGAQCTINADIHVYNGGEVIIGPLGKMQIGSASDNPCPYDITVDTGAKIDFSGALPSDRLRICGKTIAYPAGAGSCNTYPTGGIPYCEPPSGSFAGPFVFNDAGLPIELLYFNVSIPENEDRALIEWATEDEQNFDHFELERAGSDLNFKTIAEIPGAGYNTSVINKYSAYDENPLVGTGYYRLKAVDNDGTHEHFRVKSVNYNGGRKLLVWSNPTTGSSFKYSINFEPGPFDRVTLLNNVGTELLSVPVTGLENEIIPDSKLKPGAYMLRYTSPTSQHVARVFIKD